MHKRNCAPDCDGRPECPQCGEFSEYGRSERATAVTARVICVLIGTAMAFVLWRVTVWFLS